MTEICTTGTWWTPYPGTEVLVQAWAEFARQLSPDRIGMPSQGTENQMAFAYFMASPLGRGGRIVLGLALIALGIGIGGLGWVIAIVGLLPLALGIINGCILAPFLKVPFKGSDLPVPETPEA